MPKYLISVSECCLGKLLFNNGYVQLWTWKAFPVFVGIIVSCVINDFNSNFHQPNDHLLSCVSLSHFSSVFYLVLHESPLHESPLHFTEAKRSAGFAFLLERRSFFSSLIVSVLSRTNEHDLRDSQNHIQS